MHTQDLLLFIRTADCGSITGAAQELQMSTAAASAGIKRLEKQLKTSLFVRSTRQLRLSAEGEHFLLHCRQALETLATGQASMEALKGKVAGELRLSVPSDLGRNLLLPWLDEIMDCHPDLTIHLIIGDALSDFYHDRIDLALRYGKPEDSSMVAFKLATIERVLCASPSYLASHSMPAHPDELALHNCLLYLVKERQFDVWDFYLNAEKTTYLAKDDASAGIQHKIRVKGNRSCNDGDLVHRWALSGKGIANKSILDVSHDLGAGRLVGWYGCCHSIDLIIKS